MDQDNVVSIFGRKPKPEVKSENEEVDFQALFDDAIRKNEENKKRMRQDRLKANKSVLRSYRIKD